MNTGHNGRLTALFLFGFGFFSISKELFSIFFFNELFAVVIKIAVRKNSSAAPDSASNQTDAATASSIVPTAPMSTTVVCSFINNYINH